MRIVQINNSYIIKVETLKVMVTTCDIPSLSQVPMPLKVLVNFRKKKKKGNYKLNIKLYNLCC